MDDKMAKQKIAKFLVIALGGIVLLIGYLEYQKWISANWTVIQTPEQYCKHKLCNKIL